jgi:hypothetical protein
LVKLPISRLLDRLPGRDQLEAWKVALPTFLAPHRREGGLSPPP